MELVASNTFRFQAVSQKRAGEITLDTARGDAKKLEALRWDVEVRVASSDLREDTLNQRKED